MNNASVSEFKAVGTALSKNESGCQLSNNNSEENFKNIEKQLILPSLVNTLKPLMQTRTTRNDLKHLILT